MKKFNRVGLVLNGGCQEGAYQAGVITALAERGIDVDVISGQGIGGLNAAIVSCAKDTTQAAERLTQVWEELSLSLERDANLPVYIQYCLSAGHLIHYSSRMLKMLQALAKRCRVNLGIDPETGMLEDLVLSDMLKTFWNEEALANGKPLYIASYTTSSYLKGIGVGLLAATGRIATPKSQVVLIQQQDRRVMVPMVLGGTSTPLLFGTFRYNDKFRFDGRIGSVKTKSLHPLFSSLIEEQCDLVIAPFCKNPPVGLTVPVLSINPQTPLARSVGMTGAFVDYFCLEPGIVTRWVEQGYYDTLALIDVEEKRGILQDIKQEDAVEQPYHDAVQSVQTEISEEKC